MMAGMPRTVRGFRCSECGYDAPGFVGRCPGCQAWNTLQPYERAAKLAAVGTRGATARPALVSLSDVPEETGDRFVTGIPEFDRVLGGGFVPGSLVLVGGEPGIGKSTLMLQAAAQISASGRRVVYICGEESGRQVRMRAKRLNLPGDGIALLADTSLEAALETALSANPDLVIIDSIQSMFIDGLDTRAGGPAQLAEAGARLVAWSKGNEIATVVTGHVTKAGEIAGPRLLEHLVDAVLYFEAGDGGVVRILRAVKNRFGATDEVGVFEMTGRGLISVENPSAAFIDAADQSASGCAVTSVIEGSRPIAVEIQALAVQSSLASPRRIASGMEQSRLHLLLAVLARRGGMNAGNLDVVVTVSGGLKLRDPGADLAVVAALASAIRNQPLHQGVAFLGEVALSGSVRAPQQAQRRVAELARLGIRRVIAAPMEGVEGTTLVPVRTVRDAIRAVLD